MLLLLSLRVILDNFAMLLLPDIAASRHLSSHQARAHTHTYVSVYIYYSKLSVQFKTYKHSFMQTYESASRWYLKSIRCAVNGRCVVGSACVTKKSCTECIEASAAIPFQCQWCPSVGRCSDGLDRRRQEWQERSCDKSVSVSSRIVNMPAYD